MIEPKPPVLVVGGISMFMIREILGYCIISASLIGGEVAGVDVKA